MDQTDFKIISREAPRTIILHTKLREVYHMLAFSCAAGNALTIFLAGFAFSMITFPNTSRFPALVAGFVRSLRRAKPGIAKTPVFFTSAVATFASSSRHFEATAFFNSHAAANASARAPFDMALAAAFAFIGAIVIKSKLIETTTTVKRRLNLEP